MSGEIRSGCAVRAAIQDLEANASIADGWTPTPQIRWCTRVVQVAAPTFGGGVRSERVPYLQQLWIQSSSGQSVWQDVSTVHAIEPPGNELGRALQARGYGPLNK